MRCAACCADLPRGHEECLEEDDEDEEDDAPRGVLLICVDASQRKATTAKGETYHLKEVIKALPGGAWAWDRCARHWWSPAPLDAAGLAALRGAAEERGVDVRVASVGPGGARLHPRAARRLVF